MLHRKEGYCPSNEGHNIPLYSTNNIFFALYIETNLIETLNSFIELFMGIKVLYKFRVFVVFRENEEKTLTTILNLVLNIKDLNNRYVQYM